MSIVAFAFDHFQIFRGFELHSRGVTDSAYHIIEQVSQQIIVRLRIQAEYRTETPGDHAFAVMGDGCHRFYRSGFALTVAGRIYVGQNFGACLRFDRLNRADHIATFIVESYRSSAAMIDHIYPFVSWFGNRFAIGNYIQFVGKFIGKVCSGTEYNAAICSEFKHCRFFFRSNFNNFRQHNKFVIIQTLQSIFRGNYIHAPVGFLHNMHGTFQPVVG